MHYSKCATEVSLQLLELIKETCYVHIMLKQFLARTVLQWLDNGTVCVNQEVEGLNLYHSRKIL